MKLFVTLIALTILASSVSGLGWNPFRKPKKVEGGSLDIHINKYQHPIIGQPVGQPVPVGQIGQIGPIGFGIPIGAPLPIPFDQSQSLTPFNQYGQGHIRFAQIGFGNKRGIKTIDQVPLGHIVGQVRGQVSVPVLSQQSIQVVPVQVPGPFINRPQIVRVDPTIQAVQLLFNSASSPLVVRQRHYGAQGSIIQATRSEDNPHILRHEVFKPVLQDVREIIQPYRSVTQEIKPVLERVHTIVPQRQHQGQVVVKGFHEKAQFAQELHGEPLQQELLQGPQEFGSPVQQRVHFENEIEQPQEYLRKPIVQEHIQQVPIEQEPIEQLPVKSA